MNIGYEEGEKCNRGGCKGVIDEHEKEGCCSCHISPPCSYCEYDQSFCPSCGWESNEEIMNAFVLSQEQSDRYKKEADARLKADADFWAFYRGNEIATKLNYRSKGHSNSSMVKQGVYPVSMTINNLLNEIRGTFGGRFEHLDKEKGRFKYIAYTD